MGNELNIDAQLQEDWLDAKLREEMPYIDDAGFTARVMQQLPAQRASSFPLRASILMVAAVIASLTAFLGAGDYVLDSAAFLVAVPMQLLLIFILAASMLVMIAGGTFAFLKARDVRL